MGFLIAVIAVVVTVGLVVWFVATRQHPEAAAEHGDTGQPPSLSTSCFGPVNDRPAGPGAEDDGVPERGSPAPGPSAESLGD